MRKLEPLQPHTKNLICASADNWECIIYSRGILKFNQNCQFYAHIDAFVGRLGQIITLHNCKP